MTSVIAPDVGASTGPNRYLSILLWTGRVTELSATVLVPCLRKVLAFASGEGSLSLAYSDGCVIGSLRSSLYTTQQTPPQQAVVTDFEIHELDTVSVSDTCTGSYVAGSIPVAGVGCIATQLATETDHYD